MLPLKTGEALQRHRQSLQTFRTLSSGSSWSDARIRRFAVVARKTCAASERLVEKKTPMSWRKLYRLWPSSRGGVSVWLNFRFVTSIDKWARRPKCWSRANVQVGNIVGVMTLPNESVVSPTTCFCSAIDGNQWNEGKESSLVFLFCFTWAAVFEGSVEKMKKNRREKKKKACGIDEVISQQSNWLFLSIRQWKSSRVIQLFACRCFFVLRPTFEQNKRKNNWKRQMNSEKNDQRN